MIRRAEKKDINGVEQSYLELLEFEVAYGAFTRWEKDVYPTRETALKAFEEQTLHVYEEDGEIFASVILNQNQPEEYCKIKWSDVLPAEKVMVLHTLCVRPSKAGIGIATQMVRYAIDLAKKTDCEVIRLDTGRQNIPAIRLYEKNGFFIVGEAEIRLDGKIPNEGHVFMEWKL